MRKILQLFLLLMLSVTIIGCSTNESNSNTEPVEQEKINIEDQALDDEKDEEFNITEDDTSSNNEPQTEENENKEVSHNEQPNKVETNVSSNEKGKNGSSNDNPKKDTT